MPGIAAPRHESPHERRTHVCLTVLVSVARRLHDRQRDESGPFVRGACVRRAFRWLLVLCVIVHGHDPRVYAQAAPALIHIEGGSASAGRSEALTIDEAVREALERNLELLARQYDVALAGTALLTARLRPNPVLGVDADHVDPRHGLAGETGGGPAEFAIRTDFLFERGAKREHRIELARQTRSIAELRLLDHIRRLTFDVQSACVAILQARDDLALARDGLRALQDIVRLNQARVEAGDLPRVQLVRAEVAALQFRGTVRRQEVALRHAQERLRLLLGRSGIAGSPPEVIDAGRPDVQPPPDVSIVLAQARERRPDLLAVQREQARSQADIRLQLAQRAVDVTVGAEARRVHAAGNSFGVFFSMPLPVYDRNQGEVARARMEVQQLARATDAQVAEAETEVRTAHRNLTAARELLATIEDDMVPRAQHVRDVNEYSYRRGEASLLEFLDAQLAFNETMEARNAARAEYLRARYSLDAASGMTTP
jgi:cobalt-zinc-cadmium efflux system outer membrane protein